MGSEIIVALATPRGHSATATIRMSGDGCHAIAARLARREVPIQRATHCFLKKDAEIIDDVVLTLWKSPVCYTGEDTVEISCHGNPLIVQKIIDQCLLLGARLAHPGEFTQRAFLNGKMDLTQAEAVMDLITAQSDRALKAARSIQEGALGRELDKLREGLLRLLAHLEAYIDFPEEDIAPDVGQNFINQIASLTALVQKLLGTAEQGRKLREGVRVAIVGAPNAGKSSLLNALIGKNRAIVSHTPGTTRDTVEEVLLLEGIMVRFIDTAGLRETLDPVEQMGIERTRQAVDEADLILLLTDGENPSDFDLENFPAPILRCVTKCDLHIKHQAEGLKISSFTGQGLDDLRQQIISLLSLNLDTEERLAINARHESLLKEAFLHLQAAEQSALQRLHAPELASADLRQALRCAAEIVGETTNEDILDRLFSSFCIGK